MEPLVKKRGELESHYDVLVIGSGYGGGVAASALARTGLSVCVLEKGRQWRPGDFSNRLTGLWQKTRLAGRYVNWGPENALFDVRLGKQMHVLSGCGLGGGSLVNAGLAFRPDPWVFAQEKWPQPVTQDGLLQAGFERAEKMLGVAHCPAGEQLLKFRSLQACAGELAAQTGQDGLKAEPAPSTISFEPRINEVNVLQSACTLCGDCWMGCNVGAKNTVANTYLREAQQNGAAIFTGMKVNFVRKSKEGWLIYYDQLVDETGRLEGRGSLRAGLVILSAGVLGTSEILMRSKQHGLAVSDRLGEGVSANGDDLAFGHDMPQVVNGIAVGHPPRARPEEPVGPNCIGMISLQEKDKPQSQMRLQAGTMITLMAALAPFKSLLRGKPLRALKILFQGAYKGVLTRTQCFYVVGHDDAAGRLRLTKSGRALLFWPGVGEQPVFRRAEKLLTALFARTGADYMQNPVRDTILGGRLITVHPLGGCRMGENVKRGVVDHRHRVFDPSGESEDAVHDGLYIVDGSVIPTSLAANPLLTITALSERAVHLLTKEHGLTVKPQQPQQDETRPPLTDAFM